jgi:uncharacterized sporulation protein YeaH/YhbH (DUF444 family)
VYALDGIFAQQRRGARRDACTQSVIDAVPQQLEDVRALERISASEDHQRISEGFDLLDQRAGFRRVEFERISLRYSRSAAVAAREIASLGWLPR